VKGITVIEALAQYSVVLLISAMAVYAMALVAFALDLARRAAVTVATSTAEGTGRAAASQDVTVQASEAASTLVLVKTNSQTEELATAPPERYRSLRIGFSLTLVAFVLQLAADILRGLAAGRVPWANMYEFSMTGTLVIVGVFLLVNLFADLRFLGSFVIGLILILLGISSMRYYVEAAPLPPALQSYWLVIHVMVAILATGFFALGFALSAVQLLQKRREGPNSKGVITSLRILATLPGTEKLENLAYRITVVGFILWTFTLIAGSIWAERAWGRYWGWDTKEVWTFIIWVIYAAYIHARATRGWRGSRSAWLAIIGFSAVMFNFGIVNVFFKGLHSYSGL